MTIPAVRCRFAEIIVLALVAVLSICLPLHAAPVIWSVSEGGNGHAYELVEQPLGWNTARQVSTQRTPPPGFANGYLLTICDFHENSFIFGMVKDVDAYLWMGLSKHVPDATWEWVDGTPSWHPTLPYDAVYSNWNGGPSTEPGSNFAAYYALKGSWPNTADTSRPWVVEYSPLGKPEQPCQGTTFPQAGILQTLYNPTNRHTYHVLPSSIWSQAETAARSLGGHLVAINDAEEMAWVREQTEAVRTAFMGVASGNAHQFWIGLNDVDEEGRYEWSNGDPVTYTNWGFNQPSYDPVEDNVYAGYDASAGTWANGCRDCRLMSVVEIEPPHVTAVQVGGLSWNGSAYTIPIGSTDQTLPLPWTRINQIGLAFDEKVVIAPGSLRLVDVDGHEYQLFGPFSPFGSPANSQAIWMLEEPLPKGDYTLTMSDELTGTEGTLLDGEWYDSVSTASGDGAAGGDFVFHFRVLPGDVNQDGIVNVVDWVMVRDLQGTTPSDAAWSPLLDIDRRGSVDTVDLFAVPRRAFTSLPPWPASASAAASAAIPEPSTWLLAFMGLCVPAVLRNRMGRHS